MNVGQKKRGQILRREPAPGEFPPQRGQAVRWAAIHQRQFAGAFEQAWADGFAIAKKLEINQVRTGREGLHWQEAIVPCAAARFKCEYPLNRDSGRVRLICKHSI